jgi:hypothetical protein
LVRSQRLLRPATFYFLPVTAVWPSIRGLCVGITTLTAGFAAVLLMFVGGSLFFVRVRTKNYQSCLSSAIRG